MQCGADLGSVILGERKVGAILGRHVIYLNWEAGYL